MIDEAMKLLVDEWEELMESNSSMTQETAAILILARTVFDFPKYLDPKFLNQELTNGSIRGNDNKTDQKHLDVF